MTALRSEPGWELQPHQRPRTTEQTSQNAVSNDQRRRGSLQVESTLSTRTQAIDHGEPRTPKEETAWASNASSTTVGLLSSPNGTIPRWPFEENEDGKERHDNRGQDSKDPPKMLRSQPSMVPRPIHSRHVLSYWALEIITVFVAIGLLVAIVALLAHYDGHFMPEWPFHISLNSAIAFLTTFLRAAIVATVAEIVGQIKWTWFTERTRPLHHLQDFDGASRSVLGSLRLMVVVLWNWSFTSAGLLGLSAAIVTIASLAVGPVTQQALRTGTCPQLQTNSRAAIPAAHFVPGSSAYYRVFAGAYELEVDMKSTMIQGLTYPDGKDAAVAVTCSSGNCTWPDYGTGVTHASIGMCSSCVDTTDFVSAPDEGGNMTLPDDGAFINYSPGGQYMWVGYSNLSAYSGLFTEDFATAASVSFMNFSMLLSSTAPCTTDATTGARSCPHAVSQSNNTYFDGIGDYVAASCILYPCMKEYSARYENNILTEKLVKTTTAVPNTAETTDVYWAYANYTATKSPCVLDNGTWYTYQNQSEAAHVPGRTWANISLTDELRGVKNFSVPNQCLYKMDGIFFSAISSFLTGTLLTARCSYDDAQAGHINCGDSWWMTPLWGQMNATYASLDGAVSALAGAVTNKFRMTGSGPDAKLGDSLRRDVVLGSVFETTTCTYFDRGWIALPAALVLICAVLLAWIAVKNYRDPEQPVWKGSVLPLLFFGLHGPGQPGVGAGVRSPGVENNIVGGMGGVGGSSSNGSSDKMERNATFFRENGRAAPELDRIQDEAGKMWVRFHGGTDPGFVDLGTMGRRNNNVRQGDAEASVEGLVAGAADPGKRDSSVWPGAGAGAGGRS